MKSEEWEKNKKQQLKNKDIAEKHHMGQSERGEMYGKCRKKETVMGREER